MDTRTSRRRSCLAIVALALFSECAAHAVEIAPDLFSPAVYAADGVGVNSRLIVFAPGNKNLTIPLPVTFGWIVYGAGGRSLYGTTFTRLDAKTFTTAPGIVKVELNPVRVTTLSRCDGFYTVDRFAVSRREDRIVFGGARQDSAGIRTCGTYELNLATDGLRTVIETSDCLAGSPWRVFDLSPNGEEALIRADHRLARLELARDVITPLGPELWVGSYSPDGKWIAALELAGPSVPSRTILLDRKHPEERRDLGGVDDTEVVWSPDSRLILHCVYRPACPSRSPLALETLDVQNGKRSIIRSSICNGGDRQIGWVRNDIAR